jgi:hypothetical protein
MTRDKLTDTATPFRQMPLGRGSVEHTKRKPGRPKERLLKLRLMSSNDLPRRVVRDVHRGIAAGASQRGQVYALERFLARNTEHTSRFRR